MHASQILVSNKRPGILSLLLITAFALFSFLSIRPPAGSIILAELQDAGHTLLFMPLALATYWVLKRQFTGFSNRGPLLPYAGALVICAALGVITELAQIFWANRNPSLSDFMRDMAGAFGALGLFSLVDKRLRQRHPLPIRSLLGLAAATALITTLLPLAMWTLSYAQQYRQFPVLEDFTVRISPSFLYLESASLQRVSVEEIDPNLHEGTWRNYGRVEFLDGSWPGLTLREPRPDWTAFSHLAFEVLNISKETRSLNVRIDDKRHSGKYSDRFNARFEIVSGANRIRIPVREIAEGPRSRKLDTSEIAKLVLFVRRPDQPFTLYIGPIRLE